MPGKRKKFKRIENKTAVLQISYGSVKLQFFFCFVLILFVHRNTEGLHIAADVRDGMRDDFILLVVEITLQ